MTPDDGAKAEETNSSPVGQRASERMRKPNLCAGPKVVGWLG
jgi:hypothetical protein